MKYIKKENVRPNKHRGSQVIWRLGQSRDKGQSSQLAALAVPWLESNEEIKVGMSAGWKEEEMKKNVKKDARLVNVFLQICKMMVILKEVHT